MIKYDIEIDGFVNWLFYLQVYINAFLNILINILINISNKYFDVSGSVQY